MELTPTFCLQHLSSSTLSLVAEFTDRLMIRWETQGVGMDFALHFWTSELTQGRALTMERKVHDYIPSMLHWLPSKGSILTSQKASTHCYSASGRCWLLVVAQPYSVIKWLQRDKRVCEKVESLKKRRVRGSGKEGMSEHSRCVCACANVSFCLCVCLSWLISICL